MLSSMGIHYCDSSNCHSSFKLYIYNSISYFLNSRQHLLTLYFVRDSRCCIKYFYKHDVISSL